MSCVNFSTDDDDEPLVGTARPHTAIASPRAVLDEGKGYLIR